MKLSLLRDARQDVLEAIRSFDLLSSGLGDKFEDELFACFNRIKSNPDHFAANADGFRACKLNRFTAVVSFRVHDNTIFVVRVLVNGRDDS